MRHAEETEMRQGNLGLAISDGRRRDSVTIEGPRRYLERLWWSVAWRVTAGLCVLCVFALGGCGPAEGSAERRARDVEARLTAKIDWDFVPAKYRPSHRQPGTSGKWKPYTLVLRVPGVYFNKAPPSSGQFRTVELDAMWPDMRPRWPERIDHDLSLRGEAFKAHYETYWPHLKDMVRIRLNARFSGSRYDRTSEHVRTFMGNVLVDPDFHDLEYYRGTRCSDYRVKVRTLEEMQQHGCWFSFPDHDTSGSKLEPEGYYLAPPMEKDRGIDYHCGIGMARCTAHTGFKGFDLSYNFDRAYLPQWREIDAKVMGLLERFFEEYQPAL